MVDTNGTGLDKKIDTAVAKMTTQERFMEEQKIQLKKYITSVMTWEEFRMTALTVYKQTPKLATCDGISVMLALVTSVQLGLKPNTPLGKAFIIPYKGYAQFQFGYQGILDLAYRSGMVRFVDAKIVKEGDTFDYEYGTGNFLRHRESEDPKRVDAKITHVWAMLELTNGGQNFVVWTWDKVLNHRDVYSKTTSKDTPWYTNPEAMGKKTLILQVSKFAPKSETLQGAIIADSSIKTKYPDQTNMLDVPPEYDKIDHDPDAMLPTTKPQRDKLFAMIGNLEFNPDDFKEGTKTRYGLESFNDMVRWQWNEVHEELKILESKAVDSKKSAKKEDEK